MALSDSGPPSFRPRSCRTAHHTGPTNPTITSNIRRVGKISSTSDSKSTCGAPGGTRTHDLQVRNLTLYPLSYGRTMPAILAERGGFEPPMGVTP
jgi:hypothetical protein